MNRVLIFLSVIMLISACKHDSLVENVDKIDCNNGEVDFVNEVLPLLQTSCATSGCHDAASARNGIVLDEYSNIISTAEVNAGNASSSELYEVLVETGYDIMPPANTGIVLSASQKDLVKNWINQGAKNVECNVVSNTCDSVNVSYENTVKPLLEQHCVNCHTGSQASGTVWLDNYADVKLVALDGSLLGSITHSSNYEPMPEDLPKLNDCKIAIIENWINEGALNN